MKEFKLELLPKIRELEVKARHDVLSRMLTGNWVSSYKGRGMEFEDYRQYLPTDDATLIDWRASLRARKLLVKEFVQERNLNVLVLFDVSNSMLFGSRDKLKAEYAIELFSSFSYATLRAGDAVGVAMFNNKIRQVLQPNIGVRQHSMMLKTITSPSHYGGDFDLSRCLLQLVDAFPMQAMLIVISDFIGLKPGWDERLRMAGQKFDILGIGVRDPRDRRLPREAGEYTIQDPFSDEKLIIDCAQYWDAYREHVEHEERAIRKVFESARGDFLMLETSRDFSKDLVTFFHRRMRRAAS